MATSLSDGETRGKHVVILRVSGTEFELDPIPLRSVRPFVMHECALREAVPPLELHDTKGIDRYLQGVVDRLIERAVGGSFGGEEAGSPRLLPLIRLRVDYSGPDDGANQAYAIMNPQRFGQSYTGRVANPRDIVHFVRRRKPNASANKELTTRNIPERLLIGEGGTAAVKVEDLVSQYLAHQQLDLLPQNEFTDMVRLAVEKDDRDAINGFVKGSLDRMVNLLTTLPSLDDVQREFERIRRSREEEWDRLHPDGEVSSNENDPPPSQTARGRGRGRGRGAKTTTASRSTRIIVDYGEEEGGDDNADNDVNDDDDVGEVGPKSTRGRSQKMPRLEVTESPKSRWPTRT